MSSAPAAPASNGASQARRLTARARPGRPGRLGRRERGPEHRELGGVQPHPVERVGERPRRRLVVGSSPARRPCPRGARRGARRRGGCLAPSPSECTDAAVGRRVDRGQACDQGRSVDSSPCPGPSPTRATGSRSPTNPCRPRPRSGRRSRRGRGRHLRRGRARSRRGPPRCRGDDVRGLRGPARRPDDIVAEMRDAGPTSHGSRSCTASASCALRDVVSSSSRRRIAGRVRGGRVRDRHAEGAAPIWKQEHWSGGSDWAVEQHDPHPASVARPASER